MPTYEHKCSKCGHHQEHVQSIKAPKPSCPGCGAQEQYERVISPGNFVLKGSGWYQSDFKGKR